MSSPDPSSRPMKYPYTLSAKIAQFPFKFHVQGNWMYKYYLIGMVVSTPVFVFLHNLSNSPGNVRQFEEAKRKQEAKKHH